MRPMTIYVAEDGSRWDTSEQATDRDTWVEIISKAWGPLGPPPALTDGDYWQHDPVKVQAAFNRLLSITLNLAPSISTRAWTLENAEDLRLYCLNDKSVKFLTGEWYRMACFDSKGREWSQPYHVWHSSGGRCVNAAPEVTT